MFSARLPNSLEPNRITVAIEAARARNLPLVDLTESNPTVVGLRYPADLINEALADPRAHTYRPSPKGHLEARQAVASYYARHGARVDPERLTLTVSTSEAYSFLFKLLCDPMQKVLVPAPSYPLFEMLAALDGVRAVPYPLRYHAGWFVDVDELRALVDRDTRAILVVNPNNPTGSFLKRAERDRLVSLCLDRDLALVSDEVFADYALGVDPTRVTTLVGTNEVLTFCLSGLSKVVGLPQLKMGWIHASGPTRHLPDAEARLELIADTFLSVATPVQLAAGALLSLVNDVGGQILERVKRNRAHLRAALRDSAARLLEAEGGWYAVLRVPNTRTEEEWVLTLLEQDQLIVHPGFFYDFAVPAYLVISLIVPEPVFDVAVAKLISRVWEEPPP
jgi:aspartate/methionine/tyrosine aminotransferase